jgi:HAD superfamily hydrolase (TIGR01509 family)
MLRAVIFDFDGLILDTETPEFRAWEAIYRKHGAVLQLEDWLPCVGTGSIFDPHAHMESLVGRPLERDEIATAREIASHEMIMKQKPRPGVLKTLVTAKRMGLRIGLASSSSRDWVEPHLDRLGIASYFDDLETGDRVTRVKPDPEVYLKSLAALEVRPHEAIALEDSVNGLRSARSAGIFTVIIPNEMTRHTRFENPDLFLYSMEDLDLVRLAGQFNAQRR